MMTLFKGTPRTAEAAQARAYGGYFTSSNQLIPTRPPFSTAGVPVTPTTALSKVPLMAAVNLVADMPSILDAGVWTGQGGHRRQVPTPPHIKDPEGDGYGLADFAYKYLSCRMLRGNVFIRVNRIDSTGHPLNVTVLNPDEVVVKRDIKTGAWRFYTLEGDPMLPFTEKPMGGIIHRRAFASPGQALGLSVVANHARTLGLSIASEQFGSDFFADGAHPTGILATDQPVTEDQAKTIKARFLAAIRGSREPAVLGAGVKYTPIQIAPHESQFLDTQKFTAAEICRMVGPGVAEMLGYETGGKLTYQNVQSRSLHLLIYTVDKWLKDLERCLSDLFVANKQTVEFDRDGLLRMTANDRWTVYDTQLSTASRTINEVRADEGEQPVPWGDEPFLPAFGHTGTAAAEAEQIAAMPKDPAAKPGAKKVPDPSAKQGVPAPPKIT